MATASFIVSSFLSIRPEFCCVSSSGPFSYLLEGCSGPGKPKVLPEVRKFLTRKFGTISAVFDSSFLSTSPHVASSTKPEQSLPGCKTSIAVNILRPERLLLCRPDSGNFLLQLCVVCLRCPERAAIGAHDSTESNHLLGHSLPPSFCRTVSVRSSTAFSPP